MNQWWQSVGDRRSFRFFAVWLLVASVFRQACPAADSSPRAAIFRDNLPGQDETFATEIATQVSAADYRVAFIGVTTLTNPATLSRENHELLVLPNARALPVSAAPAIEHYLKQGGDLLALGLPAWDTPLFEVNGRWLSRADVDAMFGSVRPEKMIFDFAQTDLKQWHRATDNPAIPVQHELVSRDGGRALHVRMEKMTGWETYQSPVLTNVFAAGQTLTCFRARGTAHTKQLSLEWTERDGSRWIAVVDLTPEWRSYALPPEAFKAWQPPPTRSGKHDGFKPVNAARLTVGLAHSHTAVAGAEQEYWLAEVGTAANPFGDARLPGELTAPHFESVSPGYQFFPITTRSVVRASATISGRSPESLTTDRSFAGLNGIHPRPSGVGFNQERQYRWEALLTAYDATTGDQRGAVAALLVHAQPPYRGGVWAAFAPVEADFYRQPVVRSCLDETLRRMRRGVFLIEGGAEFFTRFPKQKLAFGMKVANFGRNPVTNLLARLAFDGGVMDGWFGGFATNLNLAAGQIESVGISTVYPVTGDGFVQSWLAFTNQPVATMDFLRHEIGEWTTNPAPEFVEVHDGKMWLAGKPWKAHGVNYMPSSGIGLANGQHFEHWVGRGAYDPEIIERDLVRIRAMSLNSVSVFIYRESLEAQHLLDFLRRCQAHQLRVNLSLRPGTPLDFRWEEMRELIEYYRLAGNDTVFAYDLAWEPRHEARQIQSDYLPQWQAWVQKRYVTADAARKAWGLGLGNFRFEFADLKSVPAPTMKWFTEDGPWRKLIADYRLFLDDLLQEKYAAARRLVRSVDPHHPVSFRMQHAGDATFNWDAFVPYGFNGLAGAVDIWEPEAYGRIGDWEKVKPGRFTADYARLCDATKPVVWAEMGYSVWDDRHHAPAPEKLAFQAQYFRDFYRMLDDSAADGVFFWWYPGGYRLNERSDYGIINADGTDRPVTKVIREAGAQFLNSTKPQAKPDHWISVDRDQDARGLFGIYEAVKSNYWGAVDTGKSPRLKWEHQPRGAAGAAP